MKKFGGVILTAIGALLAVLALLTIRMAVKDTMTWGGDSTVWLIEILLFAVPAVACLTSGIRRIRKAVAEEKLGFTEQERRKEQERLKRQEKSGRPEEDMVSEQQTYENAYVPAQGIYIWKYKKDIALERLFSRYRNLYFFGMILSGIALVALCVWLGMNVLAPESRKMLYLVMVLLITVLMVAGAMNIGRVTAGMMMTFARGKDGRIYFFDYHNPAFQRHARIQITGTSSVAGTASYLINNRQDAKMIKEIESHHVMERIMERGQIHPYGFPIVNVSKIREGSRTVRIFCELAREDGSTFKRSIAVPRSFEHYEELINIFKSRYML